MLNPDYRDMLSAFSDEKVQYLLVGAYALAAHGRPRATGDIDLWVNPTDTNSQKVYRSLIQFGAPIEDLDDQDFIQRDLVLQVGIEPQRIDILTSITGVSDFFEAYLERLEVAIEGLVVPVLSRRLLLLNKRATGRPQDLADAAWLESSPG